MPHPLTVALLVCSVKWLVAKQPEAALKRDAHDLLLPMAHAALQGHREIFVFLEPPPPEKKAKGGKKGKGKKKVR